MNRWSTISILVGMFVVAAVAFSVGYVLGSAEEEGAKPPVQQMTFDRSANQVQLAQLADFTDAVTYPYGTEQEARAAAELAAAGLDWAKAAGAGNDYLTSSSFPLSTTANLPWTNVVYTRMERLSSSQWKLHLSFTDSTGQPSTATATLGTTGAWAAARLLHWGSLAPSRSGIVSATGGGQLRYVLD